MHSALRVWLVLAMAMMWPGAPPAGGAAIMPDWGEYSWSGVNGTVDLPPVPVAPVVDGIRDAIYDNGWSFTMQYGTVSGVWNGGACYMHTQWNELPNLAWADNAWSVFMSDTQPGGYADQWSRRLDLVVDEDGTFEVDLYRWVGSDWAFQEEQFGSEGQVRLGASAGTEIAGGGGGGYMPNWEVAFGLPMSDREPDEQLPPCWVWRWRQLDPAPLDGRWEIVLDGKVHTPEPGTGVLFLLGLGALGRLRRRRG